MSKRDYYEILEVSNTAADAEIKKAFRRLAMKYHPDRNPDDAEAEARFKEAKEAFEVLSNTSKRAAYDQFGHAGVDQSVGGGGYSGGGFGDAFSDIFGDIFGGGGGGAAQPAELRHGVSALRALPPSQREGQRLFRSPQSRPGGEGERSA